jgi:hypothetical protein
LQKLLKEENLVWLMKKNMIYSIKY